ncbi:MAG: chemotaxis-specific protein-glutamate methyltransferase CheB [Nitrospira sp.]|nr:chemotaxis-specific protein-glutamate methyltransferase CheB [Nitrospira sp.]
MADQRKKINVLIVEDSPVSQQQIKYILESDPDLHISGIAGNGEDAVSFVRQNKPDVITMDINMPIMNGLEATRKIMETCPVPIVIVSASYSPNDIEKSFSALHAGAVAVVEKPYGIDNPLHANNVRELIQTVKLMSEVKVVKRWNRTKKSSTSIPLNPPFSKGETFKHKEIKLVVIGASTGGPPALKEVLAGLNVGFPAPILIVQHIAIGFINGLADWLGNNVPLPVHIASHGERIMGGHIYLAPENMQMGIDKNKKIFLTDTPRENGIIPSVSYLFRSALDSFGGDIVGVLLTGMGRDGADELCRMKEIGAITIAQDKDSSVVHGMPDEAIRLGGAAHVLPPDRISKLLQKLLKEQ